MAGEIVIRAADVADAAAIAGLAGQLGYTTSADVMRARLERLLADTHQCIRVAQDDVGVLAWIEVERRFTLEGGDRVEIVGLVVDQRRRGGGAGRALVACAEQWAREQGVDGISVRSNVLRDASHPFYERLGFVREKTQHYYRKLLR